MKVWAKDCLTSWHHETFIRFFNQIFNLFEQFPLLRLHFAVEEPGPRRDRWHRVRRRIRYCGGKFVFKWLRRRKDGLFCEDVKEILELWTAFEVAFCF